MLSSLFHHHSRRLLCLLLLACAPIPARGEVPASALPAIAQEDAAADTPAGVLGIASYYARRYEGRRTTSGSRYRGAKLTAASPDLPLGSRVLVVNLANDREVVVTINDRCRRRKQPFIDLSRAAATELGFYGKGMARVRIVLLEDDGDDDEAEEAPATAE